MNILRARVFVCTCDRKGLVDSRERSTQTGRYDVIYGHYLAPVENRRNLLFAYFCRRAESCAISNKNFRILLSHGSGTAPPPLRANLSLRELISSHSLREKIPKDSTLNSYARRLAAAQERRDWNITFSASFSGYRQQLCLLDGAFYRVRKINSPGYLHPLVESMSIRDLYLDRFQVSSYIC